MSSACFFRGPLISLLVGGGGGGFPHKKINLENIPLCSFPKSGPVNKASWFVWDCCHGGEMNPPHPPPPATPLACDTTGSSAPVQTEFAGSFVNRFFCGGKARDGLRIRRTIKPESGNTLSMPFKRKIPGMVSKKKIPEFPFQ